MATNPQKYKNSNNYKRRTFENLLSDNTISQNDTFNKKCYLFNKKCYLCVCVCMCILWDISSERVRGVNPDHTTIY